MLNIDEKSIKIIEIERNKPSDTFDGYLDFCPVTRTSDKNNTLNNLKRNYLLFNVCITEDGRQFLIYGDAVIEFTKLGMFSKIVRHQPETAMFFAKQTVDVVTVLAKGLNSLLLL
jgi:hypothetical protein